MKKQAFTLVELIVVITIIAILGTIAFISLQGYSKSARDSTRISDLSTMKTSLELFHLDAGKYPKATNSFDVIYSGSVIWEQGEFGSSTFKNVSRLDKLPIDPLTGKKYTYSVTKNNNEYQLGGIMETDEIVGVLNQVNAAETEARAIVEGNYNGVMFKTSTGTSCEVLTIPSIITNQEESDLLNILNSDGLVYNGKKNLPSNYSSSNFKVDGGFGFTTKKLVAYSDNENCKPLYDSKDSSARLELINGLQEAYSGTIIENEGVIANIVNISETEKEELAGTIINNSLGGEIISSSNTNNITNPCDNYTYNCTSGVTTYMNFDSVGSRTFFSDNFDGNSLNSSWSSLPDNWSINEKVIANSVAGTSKNISSNIIVSGDFDIIVDYSNFQYTGSQYAVRIDFKSSNSSLLNDIALNRNNVGYFSRVYNNNTIYQTSVGTSDISGKLRIKRLGTVGYTYYWNGSSWINIQTKNTSSVEGYIRLNVWTDSSSSASVEFDNLKVYDNMSLIADNSGNNHTGTLVGNTSIVSSERGNVLNFDGSGDYLTIADSDDFYLSNEDFTIDFWLNLNSNIGNNFWKLFTQYPNETDFFSIYLDGRTIATPKPVIRVSSKQGGSSILQLTEDINSSDFIDISSNNWYHIALVRYGNEFSLYRNGKKLATTTTDISFPNISSPVRLGTYYTLNNYLNGKIDDLRISKGIARWTNNFTPPSH